MAERIDIDLTGEATDEQAELKRKLAKRMGLAVVLIAMLLGVLAVIDQLGQPDVIEPPPPRPPVPLPRQEIAKPLAPPAESGTPAPVAVERTSAVAPGSPAAPDLPPKPEVQAQPASPAPIATTPPAPVVAAPAVPHASRPAEGPRQSGRVEARPVPAQAAASKTPPVAVAEDSAPAIATPATPVGPAAAPVAATPAPPAAGPAPVAAGPAPRPAPTAPRLFSGYLLQAGVFASAQRAEELHAKLQLNGIPSTMEARVQVGPFKTRAEAEGAREKLKALGVESVLLPPPPSRGVGR